MRFLHLAFLTPTALNAKEMGNCIKASSSLLHEVKGGDFLKQKDQLWEEVKKCLPGMFDELDFN